MRFNVRKQNRNRTRATVCIFTTSLFCSANVFAQTSAVSLEKDPNATQVNITLPKEEDVLPPPPAKTRASGELRVESAKYATAIPDNPQLNQSLLAAGNFKFSFEKGARVGNVDVTAGRYLDLKTSHYAVHELYAGAEWQQKAGKGALSFGRKLEYWSSLDQNWQLGLWQPKFMLDSLRPEEQGLTGFFFRMKNEKADFVVFASPIFIPTMGPEIREKNGSLVAEDSRWYRQPSSSISLLNTDTQLVYSLDVPDISELVAKPGLATRFKVMTSNSTWVSANAGYKPINSLLLKYKSGFQHDENDGQTAFATVSPAVGYHTIVGLDVGGSFADNELVLSYLGDRPVGEKPKATEVAWIQQAAQPLDAVAVQLSRNLQAQSLYDSGLVTLGYLKVSGAGIKDYDAAGVEQPGAIFPARLNYTQALLVSVQLAHQFFGQVFSSKIKVLREFDQTGSVWNSEIGYYPRRHVGLYMGVDILGVDGVTDKNRDLFLNQFRANDRLYGGMSYVF